MFVQPNHLFLSICFHLLVDQLLGVHVHGCGAKVQYLISSIPHSETSALAITIAALDNQLHVLQSYAIAWHASLTASP
jgi:hypothetical protein